MGLAMGHGLESRLKFLSSAADALIAGAAWMTSATSALAAPHTSASEEGAPTMTFKSTLFSLALAGLISLPSMAPVSPSHPTSVGPASYLAEIGSDDRSRMSLRPPVSRIDDAQCGPWLTCGEGTRCCPNDGTQPWDCEPTGKACPGQ
jgi:hypothetical protein